jgi:hypothetical protein
MTGQSDDDRINDAIGQLRSAMTLLNEAGARLSAAHVATAILCIPPIGAPSRDSSRALRGEDHETAV